MPVMDPNRLEDSGEMYSPDNQGEYTPLDKAPHFSFQGLSDALADVGEGTGETSVEEYALMLEVTMADCPGRPALPHSLGMRGRSCMYSRAIWFFGRWNMCK